MAMIDHLVYRVKLELFFCFHNLSTTFPPYIYRLSTENMSNYLLVRNTSSLGKTKRLIDQGLPATSS